MRPISAQAADPARSASWMDWRRLAAVSGSGSLLPPRLALRRLRRAVVTAFWASSRLNGVGWGIIGGSPFGGWGRGMVRAGLRWPMARVAGTASPLGRVGPAPGIWVARRCTVRVRRRAAAGWSRCLRPGHGEQRALLGPGGRLVVAPDRQGERQL